MGLFAETEAKVLRASNGERLGSLSLFIISSTLHINASMHNSELEILPRGFSSWDSLLGLEVCDDCKELMYGWFGLLPFKALQFAIIIWGVVVRSKGKRGV